MTFRDCLDIWAGITCEQFLTYKSITQQGDNDMLPFRPKAMQSEALRHQLRQTEGDPLMISMYRLW